MSDISVKALVAFDLHIRQGEIMPPEVQGWLTRTGRLVDLLAEKKVEVGVSKER